MCRYIHKFVGGALLGSAPLCKCEPAWGGSRIVSHDASLPLGLSRTAFLGQLPEGFSLQVLCGRGGRKSFRVQRMRGSSRAGPEEALLGKIRNVQMQKACFVAEKLSPLI